MKLSSIHRHIGKAIAVVAVLYAAYVLIIFPKWTVDDAYITFRYADNFARHGQLTWNVGHDPIEGYTGILWPLVIAGFIKADLSPILVSQILGVFFYALTGLLMLLGLRQLAVSPIISGVTLFIYATLPFLFTNALSGLETMLFVANITASAVAAMVHVQSPERLHIRFLALLLLVCSVTRPEGVAFATVVLAVVGWRTYRVDRSRFAPFLFQTAIWYLVPAAIYFGWRFTYYGELLPNTFYAKSDGGFHINHLKDLTHFLLLYFSAPAIMAAMVVCPYTDEVWKRLKEHQTGRLYRTFMTMFVLYTTLVIVQFAFTNLKMNFSYRFFVPLVPLLLLALAVPVSLALEQFEVSKQTDPIRYRLVICVVVILGMLHILQVTHRLKDEIAYAKGHQLLLSSQHAPAGLFLKQELPADEWLAVLFDAGVIPYYAGHKTIDMGGLNDEMIARNDMSLDETAEYLFSYQPGAIVFTSADPYIVRHTPVSGRIIADPRFQYKYRLAASFDLLPDAESNHYQIVYVREDLRSIKE